MRYIFLYKLNPDDNEREVIGYVNRFILICLYLLAEPVVSMGSVELMTWPDKWTVVTADGSPSAQFEHTVLITKYGVEVLTTTSINSNSHLFSL